jgi:choline dehydrogenase-like flavoprotein
MYPSANMVHDTDRARYVRGSDADYDDWATLVKDDSWSSDKVKKYMRKHQTLEPIDNAVTDRSTMPFVDVNHGTSGPVRTSFNDSKIPIEDAIIQGCDEASGYSKKPTDPWSGDHIGFFNTLGSVIRTGPNKGKRSYAARGYYEANKDRPNLKVLCEALVNKVNIQGTTATGVNFRYGGNTYDVKAKKEVIVSGGTIMSPQILELSGIGNPEILRKAGVECKINLPQVGENFQDHVLTAAGYKVQDGIFTLDGLYKPEMMQAAQKELMEKQGGPLTCVSSCQGFFPYNLIATPSELVETIQSIRDTQTKSTSKFEREQLEQIIAHLQSSKSANLQLVIIPATGNLHDGVKNQAVIFPPPSDPSAPYGVTFAMCLQYPVSRGSIHIQSSGNPSHTPIPNSQN